MSIILYLNKFSFIFALFLQDLTTEPLELLPTSPPKVVNHDFGPNVNGKSPVKSNNTTRAAIEQKKSEKNAKGKEVYEVRAPVHN